MATSQITAVLSGTFHVHQPWSYAEIHCDVTRALFSSSLSAETCNAVLPKLIVCDVVDVRFAALKFMNTALQHDDVQLLSELNRSRDDDDDHDDHDHDDDNTANDGSLDDYITPLMCAVSKRTLKHGTSVLTQCLNSPGHSLIRLVVDRILGREPASECISLVLFWIFSIL